MKLKRIICLLLSLGLVALWGCQGNYGSVDLQNPIALGENGLVEADVIEQIAEKNAIAVFTGTSNGYAYEWTLFGSDIEDAARVNLGVKVEPEGDAVRLTLRQTSAFGFRALLSVHLDESWQARSATAYDAQNAAVASVSLTGSGATVLNLTLDGTCSALEIRPDPLPVEESTALASKPETDDYLSNVETTEGEVYTGGKDQYLTDPVPAGKPQPVEPEDQEVDQEKVLTCTFSIECSTILNNLSQLDSEKLEMVPSGGVILAPTTVTFYEGESVFDVLQRVCRDNGIHMESSWTPIYNSAYVEGIHNLYEFDCGNLSGWMYRVNGWYPNYGCSRYQLQDGDVVEWRYTCDLGVDVGG